MCPTPDSVFWEEWEVRLLTVQDGTHRSVLNYENSVTLPSSAVPRGGTDRKGSAVPVSSSGVLRVRWGVGGGGLGRSPRHPG